MLDNETEEIAKALGVPYFESEEYRKALKVYILNNWRTEQQKLCQLV